MRVIAGACLGLALAGCGLLPGSSPALDGEWRLTGGTSGGDPVPIVSGSEPTLLIKDGQASGRAACNSYGGVLSIDGDRVRFGNLFQTDMYCSDDHLMASEAAYLTALASVSSATRAADSLELRGDAVELTFAGVAPTPDAPLTGTTWILDGLISGDAVASVPGELPTMLITADGAVAISSGCRTFTGSATVTPESLTLDSALTVTGCLPGFTQAEDALMSVMAGRLSVETSGKQLTLTASDGSGLVFRAR